MNQKRMGLWSKAAVCFFAAVVLVSGPVSSRAQGVVTAEFLPSQFTAGLGAFGSDSFRVGQTFTTTVGGALESISVALAPNGPLPAQVAVEFRETVSGSPSSSMILAEAFIDGNLLSGATLTSPFMLSADFLSAGINLGPDTLYAFTLRAVGPGGVFVSGSDAFLSDTYDEGSYFTSSDFGNSWTGESLSDINFQVHVVPEPASWMLVSAGLAIVFFSKKFSRRSR